MYEFICNIYEFLNLVGSYDPSYDPPIHDLIGPTRSYLGSRVCLPCVHVSPPPLLLIGTPHHCWK